MGEQDLRVHARIEGHVQGVGFRAFVEQTAAQFELKGWVRNRWDGSVETVAEGPKTVLERFIQALEKGPRSAHVSRVTSDWQPASGEFPGFYVRRTD